MVVEKVASLCRRRAIVYRSGARFLYGPLGVALRRNFTDLWWQSCVTSQDSVFGVQLPPLPPGGAADEHPSRNLALQSAFAELRTLLKPELPIGIATSVTSIQPSDVDTKIPILGDITSQEELRVYHLVPCNQVFKWTDHWQRVRLKWWRELSTSPSRFNLRQLRTINSNHDRDPAISDAKAEIAEPKAEENGPSYVVEYAITGHGDVTVDRISNLGKLEAVGGTLLEMRTSVNAGLGAYLVDAYQEKTAHKTVLAIEPKLAPYKLAVVTCSELPERTVTDVLHYVTQELRDSGVEVLNLGQMDQLEAERMYDEMGIPYTLVLTADMVESGILQLRSRDTTLKEEVHITLIKEKVLKYTRGATVVSA